MDFLHSVCIILYTCCNKIEAILLPPSEQVHTVLTVWLLSYLDFVSF